MNIMDEYWRWVRWTLAFGALAVLVIFGLYAIGVLTALGTMGSMVLGWGLGSAALVGAFVVTDR